MEDILKAISNINLLKQDKHLPTKHFLDTSLGYGFYPLTNQLG